MIKNYVLRVGCLMQPTPCISIPVISSIIGAGGSLASSVLGYQGQKESNKAYLQGIEKTNQANKELYEQSVRDNRVNWMMENSYNSPVSQIARLRAAGVNANDMISNGNGQVIQSQTPSPVVAPEQLPSPLSRIDIGAAANEAMSLYSTSLKNEGLSQELYRSGIDSKFYLQKALMENYSRMQQLQETGVRTETEREELKKLQTENEFLRKRLELEQRNLDYTGDNLERQGREIEAHTKRMADQTAIEQYQAETSRQMARAEYKRVEAYAKEVTSNIAVAMRMLSMERDRHEFWKQLAPLEARIKNMDYNEKVATAQIVAARALEAKWDTSSEFNHAFRRLFGFNVNDIISGSFKIK